METHAATIRTKESTLGTRESRSENLILKTLFKFVRVVVKNSNTTRRCANTLCPTGNTRFCQNRCNFGLTWTQTYSFRRVSYWNRMNFVCPIVNLKLYNAVQMREETRSLCSSRDQSNVTCLGKSCSNMRIVSVKTRGNIPHKGALIRDTWVPVRELNTKNAFQVCVSFCQDLEIQTRRKGARVILRQHEFRLSHCQLKTLCRYSNPNRNGLTLQLTRSKQWNTLEKKLQ